ncbi:MAG: ABC transporter ATP-binding protein [Lachnospiraceae bacterium]|nr:ABC transporter ATP-binding protein [Lachnospiraceae bacterium]
MIELRGVSFGYEPGSPVLSDITFSIAPGESVGLIGENGAGKTTLMRLCLGLLSPQAGEIRVADIPVRKDTLKEVRRKAGLLLQNPDDQLFMSKVREDLTFGPRNYMASPEEAEARADAALAQLGISALKDRYNHTLSGGEARMAAIAVVLAMDPEVLFMDEPTAALDPGNRRRVINAVKDLPQTRLIASHDLDMVLDTCSRVILLSRGRLAADGPAREVLRDKALLEENGLELPLSLQGMRE